MAGHTNILGAESRPRFFAVAGGTAKLSPPPNRKGIAVRFAARSLSVMQKEGLVASSNGDTVWRLVSDEGAYLDGFDEAPCPLSFLTTGMVSSYMTELLALAEQRGIAIRDVTLVQDNFYTMKGSALKGTMTGGAKDIELEARIDSDADAEALRALVCDAVAASPLNGLMRGEKESLFTLTHHGRRVVPDKAKPVIGDVPDDPAKLIEGVEPATNTELIRRAGMSPLTEEATSSQGSSLAEEQDRVLHIRGICTLRDDGVKRIEQQLFNPHGSIFHYLCDEHGRAPDAASYIAAGIGFCFMTQLGRYAKIAKKDLAAYNIVQDVHFSLGGASGGTGQAGSADPVETHVYLHSSEDDEFARAALDMGEQTCFLHAFCRTDLKAKVRVVKA
ncbi:OsmC family protein [Alteraurantiacibacter aquimixticola]|uniref:OsmC family peroxiredoxin n=1 Tax=Alteraurantiacibacter aquimixticola TaxID=2489173 RepID=A0A4T3F552_9SPHN|nr:OsmC family protein [Alteraurantiacibacter aquimixticola]TIX50638.1 OsmC family peroxiredoxin [Alteraurantiacibacter aquimixticola]